MKLLSTKILLNGDAGDHLLCHPFQQKNPEKLPDNYKKWALMEDWVNQAVYAPHEITYVSAYAMPPIARLIWTMREGQGDDYMKLWARGLYSDRLPRELSAYAYKGSHDGWFATSVAKATDQIYAVASACYELFPSEKINPDSLVNAARSYDDLPHSKKLNFMARISYATWIHGLIRDKKIS
jgi:hypothetical protein